MHRCFRLWCSIAIGVREIVDLHSQVCDVALYATSTLAVDAVHFVLLPLSCNRLPTIVEPPGPPQPTKFTPEVLPEFQIPSRCFSSYLLPDASYQMPSQMFLPPRSPPPPDSPSQNKKRCSRSRAGVTV